MSMEWVPPAMDSEQFTQLTSVERGFPDYMKGQVIEWIMLISKSAKGFHRPAVPHSLSLRMKMTIPSEASYFRAFLGTASDEVIANAVDALFYFDLGSARRGVNILRHILDAGLSEWSISDATPGTPRLARRIPVGVSVAYEDVISKSALAGKLLAEAFEATYGTTPNPNHAYDLSVKAVETLACAAFIPNNTTRATLGSVIAHLQQKTVSLPLIEKNANHGETITKMMRLLWEGGQRHGDGNYEHVSLEGAKTAHALAVSLVALIHEGVVSTA